MIKETKRLSSVLETQSRKPSYNNFNALISLVLYVYFLLKKITVFVSKTTTPDTTAFNLGIYKKVHNSTIY